MLAVIAFVFVWNRVWSVEGLLRDAHKALVQGKAAVAAEIAQTAVDRAPRSARAYRLLADAAEQSGDLPRAIGALTSLAEVDSSHAADCWMRVGSLEMKRLRIRPAEEALARSLAIEPMNPGALRLEAKLAAVHGRSHDLSQYLLKLIQCRSFSIQDLIVLAAIDPFIDDPERVEGMLRQDPDDLRPLLAGVRVALNENRNADAEHLLRKLVAAERTLWEAQALLGKLYSERPGDEFLRWRAALPSAAETNSRIWLTSGLWLEGHGDLEKAGRCFWEALAREPELLEATLHLGRVLSLAGQSDLGTQFLNRGKLLQEIAGLASRIQVGQDPALAGALVLDLEAAGRLWEAWAWCSIEAQARPDDQVVATRLTQLAAKLTPTDPRTRAEALPGGNRDWSRVPLPDWSTYEADSALAAPSTTTANIRFVDEARDRGLQFQFVNPESSGKERRIFETTGGGVAAFDYDGDGWTDLYFAQGGPWPVVAGSGPRDALFRNHGGQQFEEATGPSGIIEQGFSQGVAAGDFDNDGFPDLYVANIGRNRLFHNHGDGTFADVTDSAGPKEEAWTISCAIADLNGDGMPDLFDVNYLQGEKIFTTICVDDRGEPHVCRPTVFEPAPDRVALNLGDGRFVEMGTEAGLDLPFGPGMGLIVADFNSDRKLDVFVANDQTPNYLLLNEPAPSPGAVRFGDAAHLLGVAFDRDGFARASMGIACGDLNRDGRPDLFVTTFAQESKMLYLSQPDGSYVDSAREAGLRSATFDLLGFGTQFLDADLDGVLDLIVLNGHIDDVRSLGRPYHMRPQIFRGLPGPRFVELAADHAGSFFEEKRLGRAVATLDWNRDGLLDFVATDLEGPVALATNKTESAGHSLRLKLVGTTSSRDAVGARVRVVPAAGRELFAQMNAGDGFESSSERLIQVGVGALDKVDRLEIEWPSGIVAAFDDVPCRDVLLAVEGASRLTPLKYGLP